MTGYGQSGPMAQEVGHDINYVALSGVLSMLGRNGHPPPLSLVGDFGGGGMLLALGVLGALVERQRSGLGQVIDASMTEGAALLGTAFFGFRQNGTWSAERGTNIVDSGAPFYDAYETADGKWLSVAAMEPHFYRELRTMTVYSGDTLVPLFRAAVADRGDALALVGRDRKVTWNEYAREVDSLASGLRALGLRKGERVGLLIADERHLTTARSMAEQSPVARVLGTTELPEATVAPSRSNRARRISPR